MTQTKKINNYQKFNLLPQHLKIDAIKKAKYVGYKEHEIKNLYFNNDGKKLLDGMMDKNFF